MALKVGTENKRNVYIAGALFVAVIALAIYQFGGSSSTPATAPQPAAHPASLAPAARAAAGPEARKVASINLDPALHLERLALSESILYSGNGRNIFSADSAPIVIEKPVKSPRNDQQVAKTPVYTPPATPQPPPIDLHYFGYSTSRDGTRKAFLMHGEDIFEAGPGEIVNHRYKVVSVAPNGVQIIDLSYNNTQTVPLLAN